MGNANWDHIVTVEGNHHHATPSNLIYWLAQHLRAKFNLDLFHDDLSQDARRLWGWSRNAMRERFKTSFLKAGYPELIFGFHSLRAGFICSALLKANSSAMRTAVLEVTAFVGGWVAGGRAQLRYVKMAAKSCIVASRLVNPSSDQLSDDPVDHRLMAPELFHGVPLQPSQWSHTDLYHVPRTGRDWGWREMSADRAGQRGSGNTTCLLKISDLHMCGDLEKFVSNDEILWDVRYYGMSSPIIFVPG